MAVQTELPTTDILEVQQLLARYAVGMTKNAIDEVVDVFTDDGTYSAFGDTYRRTNRGWRLATRSMTFLRRNGVADSGRPHDPSRPAAH